MLSSSAGLEIMNSANQELNWKNVKGRRSRKPIARSLTGVPKAGNSASPKRVGDFSGSDSDKFGEVVPGRSTSSKSESVPLKKRRHLLQSPSPCPWTPSLHHHSASPPSSSPFSKDHELQQYPSCSSQQRSSNWQLSGLDGFAKTRSGKGYDGPFFCGRTEREYNEAGDFSGIELLAAAASMDDEANNEKKEDLVAEDSLMPKAAETTSSATQSKVGLKNNESQNSSSIMTVVGNSESFQNNSVAASRSLCGSPEDETMPKVKRQHWDLNTLMDAWGEPDDDSIAENTSKDVNDDTHVEGRHKGSLDLAVSNMGATTANNVPSNLKIEENKSTVISTDTTCSKHPSLEELFPKESSDQATKEDADKRNSTQVSSSNALSENANQVMNLNAGLEGKISTASAVATIRQDEDCSSNVSECERTTASESIQTEAPDVTAVVLPACGISTSAMDMQCKDIEDSKQTSELPGTDPKSQIDGTLVSKSTIADCQGHLEQAETFANNDDNNHPREVIKTAMMADSCKSSSAGVQCDEPTSVGRIGSGIDGDDLTRFQEGYDSPYEDGELRGSFLCSWEDNEIENECVDYESDGRNGDGSDAADYPTTSEVVEGGSEGSHGTERRNLLVKRFSEGGNVSKTEPIKQSLRRQFAKDDSDNNEMGGKGSNAGSGTTVEQSMEMVIEENDEVLKRRQLTDQREAVDARVTQTDEFASKTGRGKPQSRIAAADGKDAFYIQPCRSRRFAGSYTRPERDNLSPDRYVNRYRPSSQDERQFTSWGSRRRYNSNYQVSEGRNHVRQPPEKISTGADFHEPRQPGNYLSKGIHRPLMRRSPGERDEYFPIRRRMPQTRGASNYRTRGHYSQRSGRDFAEDFDPPLPDEAGTSVRMPRFMSRRDRSFSPSSARNGHAAFPRRRSRSRSRTRSPRPWHSHRERIIGPRSEARMERMRALPFSSKPTFGSADYGDGYASPPPRSFSPQRNGRWIDDRPFGDNSNSHLRRRRSSPVRLFRRTTQRFDGVGSSGRMKSDDYNFRPMIRPGRFKLESNYDDRRGLHDGDDDGGNVVRRFRHNAPDEFDKGSNLNNDDGVPRDAAPQAQGGGGDREDKRSIKV